MSAERAGLVVRSLFLGRTRKKSKTAARVIMNAALITAAAVSLRRSAKTSWRM